MQLRSKRRVAAAVVGVVASALALTACGGGGGGDEDGNSLSFLVDNSEDTVAQAEALVAAFEKENPDVTIDIETRPAGTEGDNLVKTRLSTGDMADMFMYNSGSLMQALNPPETMAPVEDADWTSSLAEDFVQSVTAGDDQIFGAPWGPFQAGGMMYNRKVYEQLGLQVPETWAQFMDNNEKIQAAGITPVVETFGETWTSQLFVLGDFHNVQAEEPEFPEDYTAGKAKYADTPAALRGFEHLQDVYEAGYMNEDFASANTEDGVRMIAQGEGAHWPILSGVVATVVANYPDQLKDVGFMAIPGDDASTYGLTVWAPNAVYVASTVEGEKLDTARQFQAFLASPEGCDAFSEARAPLGPYAVEGCDLPADVPQVTKDLQTYLDEGNTSLALEFVSPVKGPALENICVEVGSGIRSAEDGAALYDEDAKKQAQQLGLEGW